MQNRIDPGLFFEPGQTSSSPALGPNIPDVLTYTPDRATEAMAIGGLSGWLIGRRVEKLARAEHDQAFYADLARIAYEHSEPTETGKELLAPYRIIRSHPGHDETTEEHRQETMPFVPARNALQRRKATKVLSQAGKVRAKKERLLMDLEADYILNKPEGYEKVETDDGSTALKSIPQVRTIETTKSLKREEKTRLRKNRLEGKVSEQQYHILLASIEGAHMLRVGNDTHTHKTSFATYRNALTLPRHASVVARQTVGTAEHVSRRADRLRESMPGKISKAHKRRDRWIAIKRAPLRAVRGILNVSQ